MQNKKESYKKETCEQNKQLYEHDLYSCIDVHAIKIR